MCCLRFKFKALELNRKILEGALNPKKPAVKEPTKPEGFHLQMDKRLQEKHASKKPEEPEEHYSFHSRPLPTRILEEVVVSAAPRPLFVSKCKNTTFLTPGSGSNLVDLQFTNLLTGSSREEGDPPHYSRVPSICPEEQGAHREEGGGGRLANNVVKLKYFIWDSALNVIGVC